MFKAGRSRFAFLLAAILVLSLGITLVGGTFATSINDSVKYTTELQSLDSNNTMDYKIDLKYHNENGYVSMLGSSAPVFSPDSLWCPGRTEIVYLHLTNNEEFPVDCELSLNASIPKGSSNSGFVEALSCAVVAGDLKAANATHPANWDAFCKASLAKESTPLHLGQNVLLGGITAETAYHLASGQTTYLAVAVHMNEEATTEYAGKTLNLNFGLRLNANYETQTTMEDLK